MVPCRKITIQILQKLSNMSASTLPLREAPFEAASKSMPAVISRGADRDLA